MAVAVALCGEGRAEDDTRRLVCVGCCCCWLCWSDCVGEAGSVYAVGKVEVEVRDSESTSDVERQAVGHGQAGEVTVDGRRRERLPCERRG